VAGPADAPQRRPGFGRGIWIAFGSYGLIGVLLIGFTVGDILLHRGEDNYPGATPVVAFSFLFVAASLALLITGVSLAVSRKDSGMGAGLLLGWGLGLVLVPVLTMGACLGALNVINF
jgi:hypothetical protein